MTSLNVSLNCIQALKIGYRHATDRLHESYALATFELQVSYTKATVWLQIAFGLLSRSRSILRPDRLRYPSKGLVLADGGGLADSPRGDTPYAPTRCPQTRMQPRKSGMTGDRQGMTPNAQTRMAAR